MRKLSPWKLVFVAVTAAACGGTKLVATDAGDVVADSGVEDAGDVDAGDVDAGPACPSAQMLCDGGCIDPQSDPANCGTCGKTCDPGLVCVSANCDCAPPTKMCHGSCLPVEVDDNNCGACDHKCGIGTHCVAELCVPSKIEHVVLIVQENHTFDAYFGLYCHAPAGSNPTCTTGPDCCEGAPFTDPNGSQPFALDDDYNLGGDPNHSQACELDEIHGGAMDGFTQGSSIGSSICSSTCSRPDNYAIADVDTVSTYWQYADSYALADRYFQPIAGGSCSNDMYFTIAHEQFIDNDAIPNGIASGCSDPTGICLSGEPTTYLARVTIGDLLIAAGKTFGVYADGYGEAVVAGSSCADVPDYCPWSILHPVNRQSCLYDSADIPFQYYGQFMDRPDIMKDYGDLAYDLQSNSLPNFSFVKARAYHNEHPGVSKISDGALFVAETVERILNSPYADNTLVLVTWDEGGGFFDHVSPPPSVDTDDNGAAVPHGTRVPLLAIGKFVRRGEISHVVMDHSSVVRFLEYNFIGKTGLLGTADAKVNNLGSLLDPMKTGIVVPEQQ